jgi:hypothetical protein
MPHISADRVQETSTTTGTAAFTLAGAVTGFRTFASALTADGDTCFYAAVHATSGEWEVGLGTRASSTSLSRTSILSSSNANAAVSFSAGVKNVFITAPSTRFVQMNHERVVTLPAPTTSPPTAVPGSGALMVYPRSEAGYLEPCLIPSSGFARSLQTGMHDLRVCMVTPPSLIDVSGGPVWLGLRGTVVTGTGSVAVPTPSYTGTFAESLHRMRLESSTAVPTLLRDGMATYLRGDAAGKGGFFYHARFATTGTAWSSDARCFVGFTTSTGTFSVEPSALGNTIGFGCDSGDTDLQVIHRLSGNTATKIPLGTTIAKTATNEVLDLLMVAEPNASDVRIVVRRLTGFNAVSTLLDTTVSSNLPASNAGLSRVVHLASATTANSIDVVRVYSESRW